MAILPRSFELGDAPPEILLSEAQCKSIELDKRGLHRELGSICAVDAQNANQIQKQPPTER